MPTRGDPLVTCGDCFQIGIPKLHQELVEYCQHYFPVSPCSNHAIFVFEDNGLGGQEGATQSQERTEKGAQRRTQPEETDH